ncbi:MAG: hypothetical protein IJ250_04650 [Bacteroidales bacterium]|nr:hypothetical protein [Bacteroidales bacterium]
MRLKADIILVNRIGTEGNYLFNGRSFVVTKQGKTAVSLKEFEQTQYGFDTEDIDNVS